MTFAHLRQPWRGLPWLAALLLLWTAGGAFAQQPEEEIDPPGRVAGLTYRQGSVVFAPEGEEEWTELPQNRPLTSGDRIWSDEGSRAELHLGTATLHVDGQSHLGISALDDRAAQFILMQGSVNARVRELAQGENFEIGTPNIALRATQAGEFRIDVDPDGRETRVVVHSGVAQVFGERGESHHLSAGQQATFSGRALAPVPAQAFQQDDFGHWAAQRNQAEDQSVTARHVPRGVVGYAQLDAHGTWSQDPNHGAVWYPRVTVADWAPYRYGRWTWVDPWGWTWIDDAAWGFAPFHYGRWAMVGARWAWVPGRMVARPVYSPALVSFFGSAGGVGFSVGSGPGVGWYPLAPGEAWWPAYRTSPRYVNFANFNINLNRYPRHFQDHTHRRHGHAITAVREDDFRRGRATRDNWRPLAPSTVGQARFGAVPMRPDGRERRDSGGQARIQVAPRTSVQPAMPSQFWGQGRPGWERARQQRDAGVRTHRFEPRGEVEVPAQQPRFVQQQPGFVQPAPAPQPRFMQPAPQPRLEPQRPAYDNSAVHEQRRAQQEQWRLQRDADRAAREQQREAWRQRQPYPGSVAPPSVQMQPQVRQQESLPIGRTDRGDRGERGDRGGERGDRGGRWQRDDDGGQRHRGGPQGQPSQPIR